MIVATGTSTSVGTGRPTLPELNACVERLIQSVQVECLDDFLVAGVNRRSTLPLFAGAIAAASQLRGMTFRRTSLRARELKPD
jgi:hypothetical protein